MADLPADIEFGYVVMSAVYAVGDTTDDVNNDPESVPAIGTIHFNPVVKQVISTVGDPTMILPQGIDCVFDGTGRMVDQTGAEGVWLITGFYDVTFTINDASISGFQINVENTHTALAPLDLTLAFPLVPSPVEVFVVNEQVYLDTLAARDEALAAVAAMGNPVIVIPNGGSVPPGTPAGTVIIEMSV